MSFRSGRSGKADQYDGTALVALSDSGFAISITDTVSITDDATGAAATFHGPLESAVRLMAGRLGLAHTPDGVKVTGAQA